MLITSQRQRAPNMAPQGPRELKGHSKKSQLHIARIVQFIAEHGHASAAQLSGLLGLDAGTMSRYLRHMCGTGVIHLAQRHCTEPGRQRPALYGAGAQDDECDGWAELPPQVRHTSHWTHGTVGRDPLVEALFGPAHKQDE